MYKLLYGDIMLDVDFINIILIGNNGIIEKILSVIEKRATGTFFK